MSFVSNTGRVGWCLMSFVSNMVERLVSHVICFKYWCWYLMSFVSNTGREVGILCHLFQILVERLVSHVICFKYW